MDSDEWARLRRDRATTPGRTEGERAGGGAAFLGRVVSSTFTLGAGRFFRARPLSLLGAESEGGAASVTAADETVLVLSRGGDPPVGDDVVCDWCDHRWCCTWENPCLTAVKVVLRRMSDGSKVAGAAVEVRSQFGSPGTLIGSGTTDADGEWTSPGFSRTVGYRVVWSIPSAFEDNDGDPLSGAFVATYGPNRGCAKVHEYDYCEAEVSLTVLGCGEASGAVTGLVRGGTADSAEGRWAVTAGNVPALGNLAMGYSGLAPAFSESHFWAGFAPVSSDGVYRDVWFLLVERPYTLAAPLAWKWSVNRDPFFACDNDGRYKPDCGGDALLCGQTNSATAHMFGLGSLWTVGPGPDCGFSCGDGPYGANVNLDCTPSGLIRRILQVLVASNDSGNAAGALEGQTVEVHCTQDGPGLPIYWISDPISNDCGGYYLGADPTLHTPLYRTTSIVAFRDGFKIQGINGAPDVIPHGGLFYREVGGLWETFGANSYQTGTYCHPTLIEFGAGDSDPAFSPFSVGVEGLVFE